MVALRPVPGIRVEQALTLCRTNRTGDIVSIGDNRLVLFLSFCRVNDLDTALNHIFPLPTADIFSNRMVWFEDNQIAAELVQMRTLTPEQWAKPLIVTSETKKVINAEHDGTARAASRNITGYSAKTRSVHHDVDWRYRSAYCVVRVDLLPLGYLARHWSRPIRTALRLTFSKPRYVKPIGTLRRESLVKADRKHD